MSELADLPTLITSRRAELEALAEKLTGELAAVHGELEQLKVAEEVSRRLIAQSGLPAPRTATPEPKPVLAPVVSVKVADEAPAAEPVGAVKTELPFNKAQVPERTEALDYADLPEAYRPIVFAVREAGVPLRAVDVAEELNLGIEKNVVESVRPKLIRLAKRGWLNKRDDGKFEAVEQA